SALDERRAQLANRAAHERTTGLEEGVRAAELAATLRERRGEHERLGAEALTREAQTASSSPHAAELARELAALDQATRELRTRAARANEQALASFDERTRAENRARSLSEALPAADERLQRARERAAGAVQAAQQMRDGLEQALARSQ